MRRLKLQSRKIVTVSALVAAFLLGSATYGAVELAGAAGTNTVYYACLSSSGALSHVGTTKPTTEICKAPSKVISWNSQGPAGAKGPAGATGARGPAGAQGPAGPGQVTNLHTDVAWGSYGGPNLGSMAYLELYCGESENPNGAFTILNDQSSGSSALNWDYSNGTTVSADGGAMAFGGYYYFPNLSGGHLDGQWIFDYPGGVVTLNMVIYSGGPNQSCTIQGTATESS